MTKVVKKPVIRDDVSQKSGKASARAGKRTHEQIPVQHGQHPGAKKYRDMMEKMVAKNPRNTAYRDQFVPPEQAEFERSNQRNQRAKTQDNRVTSYDNQKSPIKPNKNANEKVSNLSEYRDEFWNGSNTVVDKKDRNYNKDWNDGNNETEYRKDYTDPHYQAHQKQQEELNKPKKKLERTEYNDEYNEHHSTIRKKERRATKEWEDGFGQTEYRKDFTDPEFRKSIPKEGKKG